MENENAIRIRNILLIMILLMIIYIILAILYSFIVNSNIFTLNTPPPVKNLGDVINNTSDKITNVVKDGLDIVNGSVHMTGNLLNKFATPYTSTQSSGFKNKRENFALLDEAINMGSIPTNIPEANDATMSNTKWCYIGNFNGERGCAKIDEYEKCPGPIFDNKNTCVSPENSPNRFLESKYNYKRRTLE